MPFPSIAKGLRALGGIYARWREGRFAVEPAPLTGTTDPAGDTGQGLGGAVNSAVSVITDMPGSTAIEKIAYNAITSRMDVTFRGRRGAGTYIFSSVPRMTWVGWLQTKGGSYYHRHVKQYSDVR